MHHLWPTCQSHASKTHQPRPGLTIRHPVAKLFSALISGFLRTFFAWQCRRERALGIRNGPTGAVKITPPLAMHTLGHQFSPPGIHAGGLRYHGMAPIVSRLVQLGLVEAQAYAQTECFEAAVTFARTEAVIPVYFVVLRVGSGTRVRPVTQVR